jgi:hypothetical protein
VSAGSNPKVLLTHRALVDIQKIDRYSARLWGKKTANKSLDDLEAARFAERWFPELDNP